MTQEFYMITELASDLGVSPRALRYYEKLGLIAPSRLGSMRVYTRMQRKRLRIIVRGRRLGFSLLQIKDFLDRHKVDSVGEDRVGPLLAAIRRCICKQREDEAPALTPKGFA